MGSFTRQRKYRSFSMGRGRKELRLSLTTASLFDEDSLIMANIRALAIIGFLVTLGSGASIAMPPQDIPAEVKSCKAIADDKERLKCFDGLFGETFEATKILDEESEKPPEEKQRTGQSTRPNRPLMAIREVVAANLVSDTVLILRCKDQTTEAAFSTNTIISAINLLM